MARQGHSFATAEETRVVNKDLDGSLIDVPEDGKTLGEIAVRGNIVMKEVRLVYEYAAVSSITFSFLILVFRRP